MILFGNVVTTEVTELGKRAFVSSQRGGNLDAKMFMRHADTGKKSGHLQAQERDMEWICFQCEKEPIH